MRQTFFYGCVENRNDPLKLGRYQIRVVGVHTEDKAKLPTKDLPWAITLQPTTSAGVSGVGLNPGLVNGSWVMVIFTSDDLQVPIVLGSVAGIPGVSGTVAAEAGQDAPPANEASPKQKEVGVQEGVYPASVLNDDQPYLGSLTKTQYNQFVAKSREIESSGNYSAVNSLGYLGAYQFGAAALEDLGYIKKGSWAANKKNSLVDSDLNWTGKDGVTGKIAFLGNTAAQDNCMLLYSQRAYKLMSGKGQANPQTDPRVLAGLLGAAHNQGTGCISKLIRGETTRDGNGTTAQSYYDRCYAAITVQAGQETNTTPSTDPNGPAPIPPEENLAPPKKDLTPSSNMDIGFKDPESKYPTYRDEADTHRLVRGQNITNTIVDIKEKERVKSIGIGLSAKQWDQPSIQYAAQYPYNHAQVTETGHVFELDDTPSAERVHLYHRSGTFLEIDQGGNQVNKIVGHGVEIIERDGHIYIKGNGHMHIEGRFTLQTDNAFIEMKDLNIKSEKTIWHNKSFEMKCEERFAVEASNITLSAKELFQASGKTNAELSSRSKISIKSGGNIGIDGGPNVHINSGMASISSVTAVANNDKFSEDIMSITSVSREDSEACVLDEHPQATIINADKNAEAPPVVQKTESTPQTAPAPTETGDCPTFDLTLGDNIQLSPNYKLKDLCRDGTFNFNGQHGISAQEMLCNMSKLCLNIIEPLRAKYGSAIKVNSCWRPAGSKISAAKGISQHEKGEAVDIGFNDIARGSTRKEQYYNRAVEIQPTIPYDKFLFETRSGADTVWLHLSFSRTQQRKEIYTLVDDKTKVSGKIVLFTP